MRHPRSDGILADAILTRRLFLRNLAAGVGALPLAGWSPFALATQPAPELHTDVIVVRLSEGQFGRIASGVDDLRTLAVEAGARQLSGALSAYPQCGISRLITSVPTRRVLESERTAAHAGFAPRHSLTLFWRIHTSAIARADRDQFLRILNAVPGVHAYRELRNADAAVDDSNDPHAAGQTYLDAAPTGIGARWAWKQSGRSGETVGFADIQMGWLLAGVGSSGLQHEDLPIARLSPGVPRTLTPYKCSARPASGMATPGQPGSSHHHGTATVGIVAGRDNLLGIAGVAPNVAWMDVASHYGDTVANAIHKMLDFMTRGDVLLVSAQKGNNDPAEVDIADLGAIQTAVGKGVIVIEPAGNGNHELPPALTATDSGAIIVGGCKSALSPLNAPPAMGHRRWVMQPSDFDAPGPLPSFMWDCNERPPQGAPMPGSNFGTRVDCHAWAENVVTAGYGWLGGTSPTNAYTHRFGGTSAAAPIVAGAAIVLQSMYKAARNNNPLSPSDIRAVLRANGTAQAPDQPGTPTTNLVGVMPDLYKCALALALVPSAPAPPTNTRIVD